MLTPLIAVPDHDDLASLPADADASLPADADACDIDKGVMYTYGGLASSACRVASSSEPCLAYLLATAPGIDQQICAVIRVWSPWLTCMSLLLQLFT